jgi:hypothetical protein
MCAPLPSACAYAAAAHVKWILPAWLNASVATDCSVLVLGGADGPGGLTAISEGALVVYTGKKRVVSHSSCENGYSEAVQHLLASHGAMMHLFKDPAALRIAGAG